MMETGEYIRKLAAILSADVVGYSRLMEADELTTIATLKEYRSVFQKMVNGYRGRIVDSPGDNILAEFASVMDAVRCAFDIQKELKGCNEKLPAGKRMLFRIGINIGDIIQEGEKIYGDGVNIAARVEGLAEGGGVSISGTVYEHIRHKLTVWDEFVGTHSVKNISDPISVYRIYPGEKAKPSKKGGQRILLISLAAAACLSLLLAVVMLYPRESGKPVHDVPAETTVNSQGTLLFEGEPLEGEWQPYAKPPATSSLFLNKEQQVVWTYMLPESNEEIYAGMGCYIDAVPITDHWIVLTIESEKGLPLELRLYSFVSGFSKPGDENSWVPGEVLIKPTPGRHTFTIHAKDFEVPWWWRREKGNKDVAFSSNDIRMIELGAVRNDEADLTYDRVVIQSIRIEWRWEKDRQ